MKVSLDYIVYSPKPTNQHPTPTPPITKNSTLLIIFVSLYEPLRNKNIKINTNSCPVDNFCQMGPTTSLIILLNPSHINFHLDRPITLIFKLWVRKVLHSRYQDQCFLLIISSICMVHLLYIFFHYVKCNLQRIWVICLSFYAIKLQNSDKWAQTVHKNS